MFKRVTPACVAALLALSSATYAQEAAQSPEADQGAVESAQSEGVLDLGQPVTDGPQLGSRYAKETFGDWTLACIKTEAETDPCSLLQVMNGPDGQPMAEMSLFRIENSGAAIAGATIIVPLETLLTAPLVISVDGAPGKRYNYTLCNPVGCVAQIGLTQADIDAMKKGTEATISLVPAPAPDQKIDIKMSLKGFTAGFNAVDVVDN
ncbi:invasion associated locus B family protein [Ruegeria sp. 2205SS24-7]|uniref:invasion associated locus B family protein n=1 Tax=Ruegeria discodermiae TaxID=3064389 RepID=UPI002741BDC0|nr:invasion associated locus B family protein [Ruegeria sp. 2205SS24-7]MDP5216165.1 invasion associated locus B family protein [Ruegeria sp. 2205SS24-7]